MGNSDTHTTVGNVHIKINTKRLKQGFKKAQYALDTAVMQDMLPYMPEQTGMFKDRTLIESTSIAGTGKVCAGANPQGRFLYYGKVMVGENSRSAWAKLGETKVVTDKPLSYANGKGPFWFEEAKRRNMRRWKREAKKGLKGR